MNKEYSFNSNSLLQESLEYRLDREPFDVTIKVSNLELPVHRFVLTHWSPVLGELLEHGNFYLVLDERFVDPSIVLDLFFLFYKFKLTLNKQNAHLLLISANYLQISTLISTCEQFFAEIIVPEDVFRWSVFSNDSELRFFTDLRVDYVVNNVKIVVKMPEFLDMDVEDLKTLLSDMKDKQNLSIKSKKLVFRSVIRWIEKDSGSRLSSLNTLLRYLPLEDLLKNPKFYKEFSSKTIISNPCSKFFIKDIGKVNFPKEQSESKNICRVYCFGGDNHKDRSVPGTVCSLDMNTRRWTMVKQLSPVNRYDYCGAAIESKIYLCGGVVGTGNGTDVNTVEVFDCESQTWRELSPMSEGRRQAAAAAIGKFIYVTGGGNRDSKDLTDKSISNTVFRYSVETNEWVTLKPMLKARSCHQLVAFNSRLYAIGGMKAFGSVEEYDPKKDEWKSVAKSFYRPQSFGAAVHDDKIYAFCGDGFQVYCPLSNFWKELFQVGHLWGASVVSAGGLLMVIGGCIVYTDNNKTSVFCYELEKDEWSRLVDMDVPRREHCSFVVQW